MIQIERREIIQKLQLQTVQNFNGHNHLLIDAMHGRGDQAMAFLVKRGAIQLTMVQMKDELNLMVENNMLTIEQWENMLRLLETASNGTERIANFLRKKRRIRII